MSNDWHIPKDCNAYNLIKSIADSNNNVAKSLLEVAQAIRSTKNVTVTNRREFDD